MAPKGCLPGVFSFWRTVIPTATIAKTTKQARRSPPRASNSRADASDLSPKEAAPQQKPARKRSSSTGVTGSRHLYGRFVDDEQNSALKDEKAYEAYDLMRRTDTDVHQSLELLKNPILACNWVIEPASSKPIDREIADFVASNLFEDLPWGRINRESLLRFDYGCYMFETLTHVAMVERRRYPNLPSVRSSGRPKAGEMIPSVRWRAFDPRHPRTVRRWLSDPELTTQLDSVVQWFEGDDLRQGGEYTMSADNLLRFTHCQEAANFGGRSVLRPIWADFREKSHLRKVEAVRHERQNCGLPTATEPEHPDPEDVDAMEEALEALSSYEQSFLMLPFGWAFKFDTSGAGEGTKLGDRLAYLRRSVLDNVLAGFMALGDGDTGSYAMAGTQQERQVDYVDVNVKVQEETFNKGSDGVSPVRALVDANYGARRLGLGSEGYPRLRAKNVRGRNYMAVMKLLAQLVQSKAITATPAVQRFIFQGLDIDGPEIVSGDEGDDGRGNEDNGGDNSGDASSNDNGNDATTTDGNTDGAQKDENA